MKPLKLLGIFLIVVGVGYFIGAGYALMQVNGGYNSLQKFSEAQNVTLNYNDDGKLIDRGQTEEAEKIMAMLKDDWGYPVSSREMNPDDPLINTASEYMYQMATISYHVLHGTQNVVLSQEQIDSAIEAGNLAADGTYDGNVAAYKGQALTPGTYEVPIEGRYWTGFDRNDVLEGPARDLAWSATAHALIGELGVGTLTATSLKLALGIAGILGGLGVLCTVSGILVLMADRRRVVAPVVVEEQRDLVGAAS